MVANKMKALVFHTNIDPSSRTQYRLTLCGAGTDKIELLLDARQMSLLDARFTRAFYIRCRKDKILYEIGHAADKTALEKLSRYYGLCDVCCLDGISLSGAKRTLCAVVETLYRYPKLRSKICFIGTHHEFARQMLRLETGDRAVLANFNLQYICSDKNAAPIGRFIRPMLADMMKSHQNYVATTLCIFGLFDAVLLDQHDYDEAAYPAFVSELRDNERSGYHPKSCGTPESILYHELGHLIDNVCEISQGAEFRNYFASLPRESIKQGLSQYALSSPQEFLAEAFAEGMCNPTPRVIASRVMRIVERAYASANLHADAKLK